MIPFDSEYFKRVELEGGRSRRDDNGAVVEERGFHASIVTPCVPGTEKYTNITLRAGAYGAYMSPNSCSIQFDDTRYDALRTVEKQCAILRALVEAWNPDYGLANLPRSHGRTP
jgi:hypothetical protein